MNTFVVFDKNKFLGTFSSLKQAQQHITCLIDFCKEYGGNINKANENLKIIEYNMHLIINTYTINEPVNETESEINLFIPISSEKKEEVTMEELQKKMDYLTKLKEHEMLDINQAKEAYEKKELEYMEEKAKIEKIKLEMKRAQEKYEEIQKKFDADKKLYFIFKQEIIDGTRDENDIPILFKDTYPIFKQLEEENKLNVEDELKYYLELLQYQNIKSINITSEYDDLFKSD